jgi:hypothetical protein
MDSTKATIEDIQWTVLGIHSNSIHREYRGYTRREHMAVLRATLEVNSSTVQVLQYQRSQGQDKDYI